MTLRELLSDESKWTQNALVRAEDGRRLRFVTDSRAVCWCLIGAIERCYGHDDPAIYERVEIAIESDIGSWNDAPGRTFADVRALIERLGL